MESYRVSGRASKRVKNCRTIRRLMYRYSIHQYRTEIIRNTTERETTVVTSEGGVRSGTGILLCRPCSSLPRLPRFTVPFINLTTVPDRPVLLTLPPPSLPSLALALPCLSLVYGVCNKFDTSAVPATDDRLFVGVHIAQVSLAAAAARVGLRRSVLSARLRVGRLADRALTFACLGEAGCYRTSRLPWCWRGVGGKLLFDSLQLGQGCQ